MLHLRPMILVKDGKMEVGKKYRGSYNDCMVKYIKDKIGGRDDLRLKRVFITHTACPADTLALAEKTVRECQNFGEILDTDASCTISNHCGESTLGVLFIRD